MKIDYSIADTPEEYVCSKCGETHCKLWREYNTVPVQLMCATCAAKDNDEVITDMNEYGQYTSSYGHLTNKIGDFVPAVPDEEGAGYWGYFSIPEKGFLWWEHLPNYPVIEKSENPEASPDPDEAKENA